MKNIVFYGDSIVANFKQLEQVDNLINMGIGGDKTIELIGRINAVTTLKPEKLFILVGINDFLVNKEVWGDHLKIPFYDTYELLLRTLKLSLPNLKIYTLAIFPINKTNFLTEEVAKKYNEEILIFNENISKISSNNIATHLNFTNKFKDSDGLLIDEYTIDGIHLSELGYNVFYNNVKPYFEEK